MKYLLIFIILLTQNSLASATCYRIFDPTGQVVYQSSTPPVDLSGSISQAVESKFPGGHLIINQQLCNSSSELTNQIPKNPSEKKVTSKNEEVLQNLVDQTPTWQEGGLTIHGGSSSYDSDNSFSSIYSRYIRGYSGYSGYSGYRGYSGYSNSHNIGSSSRSVHVRSYNRSNGTHVRSHYRSAPRSRR